MTTRLTILTGAVLGLLVPLTSVGAGALGVTALILLYPDLPVRRIVGSDIAHAVPLTFIAGMGHWLQGSINPVLLATLLARIAAGIAIGSFLVPRVPDRRCDSSWRWYWCWWPIISCVSEPGSRECQPARRRDG